MDWTMQGKREQHIVELMKTIYSWSTGLAPRAASFGAIEGIDPQISIDLSMARPAPKPFPRGAYLNMDAKYPKDVRLVDQPSVFGMGRVLLGSRVVDYLKPLELEEVRWLPVELRDHKGRVASTEYYLLHSELIVDGIDPAASGAMWNPIAPDSMSGWDELTLKDDFVAPSLIFRLRHIECFTFVTEELKDLIEEFGVENAYFEPLDEVE